MSLSTCSASFFFSALSSSSILSRVEMSNCLPPGLLLSYSLLVRLVSFDGVLERKLAPPDLMGMPSPIVGLCFQVMLQELLSRKELYISHQAVRMLLIVSILSRV